jgi:hypothetical protein
MRDGDLEEGECNAGEEPEEHPDDAGGEDEEEAKVIRTVVAASKT